MRYGFATLLALGLAASAAAHEAPSVPRVDAPELAQLGRFAAGVSTVALVDAARNDRRLEVDLWYPAVAAAGAALAALIAAWLALQVMGAVQTGHLVVHPRAGGVRHYLWAVAPGAFVFQLVLTSVLAGLCALVAWVGARMASGRRSWWI